MARTDTERLDWLERQREPVISADGEEHIANLWRVEWPAHGIRDAIDKEMAQEEASRAPR